MQMRTMLRRGLSVATVGVCLAFGQMTMAQDAQVTGKIGMGDLGRR